MKYIEVTHNLSLLYAALKLNKAAWNQLNIEIKTLKTNVVTDSDKILLEDKASEQTQIYAVIVLLANCMVEALANTYRFLDVCNG